MPNYGATRAWAVAAFIIAAVLAVRASEPLGGTWGRPQPARSPMYWEHSVRGRVDAFADVAPKSLLGTTAITSVVYDLIGSDPSRALTWEEISFDGYDASGISLGRHGGAYSDSGASCFASFVAERPSLPVDQAKVTAASFCRTGAGGSSQVRLPIGGVFTVFGFIGNTHDAGFGLSVTFSIDGGDLVATVKQ